VNRLRESVVELVHREGPIGFDRFLELALYDAEAGFYTSGGRSGRRGDFITSPEVGPLFGAVIASVLDDWWREMGEPDPFTVVDAGSGPGTLARAVVAADPECADSLTYLEVEHADVWPLFPFDGVILANELLDNLPFRVLQRAGAGGWEEVGVGVVDGEPAEIVLPVALPDDVVARADGWAPRATVGDRIPYQERAARWVADSVDSLFHGHLLVLDYGATTAELAGRDGQWLRTYRGHERGGPPLDHIGEQDITADVAVDQVTDEHPPTEVLTQADFLARHGIEELVEDGRRIWHERAHIGDLEAIRGRSRVREAEALLDPTGLGAFVVLHWSV
jgi:SAM-dependent MidA family methyltransferase